MNYLAYFFAGAFLCNAIPHTVCGLQGVPFPSPFASPPGVGNSSPLVNFLWGVLNATVGILLIGFRPIYISINPRFATFILGVLLIGIFLSLHFGKVRQGKP